MVGLYKILAITRYITWESLGSLLNYHLTLYNTESNTTTLKTGLRLGFSGLILPLFYIKL